MNKGSFQEKCWPTDTQRLVLQAGLLDKEYAIKAWRTFITTTDINDIDDASFTLLPLIYKNIERDDSQEFKRCEGVYKYTWCKNQIKIRALKSVLELLNQASIEWTLLKGIASIAGYYQDAGVRVMGDVDFLVNPSSARYTIELLEKNGWIPLLSIRERNELDRYIKRTHAVMLKNSEDILIDLHWCILGESGLDPLLLNYPHQTRQLQSTLLGNITLLRPEDHLIHTLYHGLKRSPIPIIRFVADATILLKKSPDFDWIYFIAQVTHLKLEFALYKALRYLVQYGFITLPIQVKNTIKHYHPSAFERRYFASTTAHTPGSFSFLTSNYWHAHVRNASSTNPIYLLFSFPYFIRNVQGLKNWPAFTFFIIKGITRHLARLLK